MRTFIAIDLSGHAKAKIFHTFENLQGKDLFRGKFVDKENIHLTLKFFGNISEEQLKEIKTKLSEIKFEKFECKVGSPGVFDENYIKVIWVDLVSDELMKLQKQINDKFPEFPSDYKKFSAHITIARVNLVRDRKKLIEEINKIKFQKLFFTVEDFLLMKSIKKIIQK